LTAGAEAVLLSGDVEEILQLECFNGGSDDKTISEHECFRRFQMMHNLVFEKYFSTHQYTAFLSKIFFPIMEKKQKLTKLVVPK